MGGIGVVEGAVDVATPALHGRVSLSATIVVFTAFHLKCPMYLPKKEYPFYIMRVEGGRRFTRKQCKKFTCAKMGFTQKASCRPYKNCYKSKKKTNKTRR
jgi:hypothetical protein